MNKQERPMSAEEYNKYLTKPLNNNKIITFNKELEKEHKKRHKIMPVPAHYTLLDALCYMFDNNAIAIAEVIQDNIDMKEHALQLFWALEEGIKSRTICLQCIKEAMKSIYQ